MCCVDDPDALAKDACEAGLLSREMMAMLTGNSSMNGEAKTRSMLENVLGVVSLRPHLSRNLLAVLRKQPNVKNLLIVLQIPGESIKQHRLTLSEFSYDYTQRVPPLKLVTLWLHICDICGFLCFLFYIISCLCTIYIHEHVLNF